MDEAEGREEVERDALLLRDGDGARLAGLEVLLQAAAAELELEEPVATRMLKQCTDYRERFYRKL